MNKKNPLKNLVIRTAVVRAPDLGFIYACDLKKERDEIPHAIVFTWDDGKFEQVEFTYDAHSVCIIEDPMFALVDVSEMGYYTMETISETYTADIFEKSLPPPKTLRGRGIRSVSEIGGKAYAVGFQGMVYRLDKADRWERIDEGLPDTFEIEAIHGFSANDLYAVGDDGEMWHYDGKKWTKRELPTNAILTTVRCAGNDTVFIAGHGGILIGGRKDEWEVIKHDQTDSDIWDLEWFQDTLYVSTMTNVYQLKKESLELVDFGNDKPKSCYQLSAAKGVMWSNGEFDIMSFDGKKWTRIV